MAQCRVPVSEGAEGVRRAAEAALETVGGGMGQWSAKRKTSVAPELLRRADLESAGRKCGVTAATLSEWREAFWRLARRGSRSGRRIWPAGRAAA